ncbi:histidinol-phosphatase [Trichosporon asahii var. asahii CBS 8904]|uniref:Histidinol-phosphatase n=2 Tax=Trichosporon asahii var. asahii TaxID=189963 RepID=K1VHX5_TRIAC|nr:histidinol-phosphatase [Trichosporon asahii var. asahii CBS 2479]EJT52187.1 histidinol-phosphatase [Trichosporon asahii var. asahii CBS 2479]EKC98726.1 histidinol-phosphatase [Trichosporon asahii var. asahii CBS 8904]
MHSHHSHSGQFCRHAKDNLEDVVKEAVRQGFTTFGLSEHAPRYREQDLFPEESDLTPTDLSRIYLDFLTEALRLKAKYADRITLLVGIETDFISPLDMSELTTLLSQHEEIDYVVGSVHHVSGVSIDFDRPNYLRAVADCASPTPTMVRNAEGELVMAPPVNEIKEPETMADIEDFVARYLDAQFEMIIAQEPEVIGHFDLCMLFTPQISLKSSAAVWEKVERNVDAAISYGALFEANAAAFRKGWNSSYPAPDVLQLILSKGGRVCLSDDSHGVSYVGLNYGRLREYLVAQGVEEIWYLVPRDQEGEKVGKRGRVKAKPLRGWERAEFWSQ